MENLDWYEAWYLVVIIICTLSALEGLYDAYQDHLAWKVSEEEAKVRGRNKPILRATQIGMSMFASALFSYAFMLGFGILAAITPSSPTRSPNADLYYVTFMGLSILSLVFIRLAKWFKADLIRLISQEKMEK